MESDEEDIVYLKEYSDRGDGCQSSVCSCTSIFSSQKCDDIAAPIKNWNNWQEKRKKMYNHLSMAISRSAGSLVMNLGDYMYYINEEKRMLENMKIPVKFDKYRGNPAFWKTPVALHDPCYKKDPRYLAYMTKVERNIRPDMEYSGVPTVVREEQGLMQSTRNMFTKWKQGKYRIAQMKKLRKQLSVIQPHMPNCCELALSGHKVVVVNDEVQIRVKELSEVAETFTKNPSHSKTLDSPTISVQSCIINNIRINKYLRETKKTFIIFEYVHPDKEPFRSNITFVNTGTITLRFNFAKSEKPKKYQKWYKKSTIPSPFYFDKEELLVTPGETVILPIWFTSPHLGRFAETWNINSLPKFNVDVIMCIRMLGIVTSAKITDKIMEIKTKISSKAKRKMIQDTLNEIFDSLKYKSTPVTTNIVFCEPELFEAINQDNDIFKINSTFTYDRDTIGTLKKFYKEVRQDKHPLEWNFSIKQIKRITRERDLIDYAEGLYQKMLISNESRKLQQQALQLEEDKRKEEELNWMPQGGAKKGKGKEKGKGKADKKKKDKTSKKSSKSSKSSKKDSKKRKGKKGGNEIQEPIEELLELYPTRYRQLEAILQKLRRPVTIKNENREKYLYVFATLRACFTNMSMELSALDDEYCTYLYKSIKYVNFSTDWCRNIPERRIYERFDDVYIERSKRVFPASSAVLPKTELLTGINLENSELVYKVYFGGDIESGQKEGKGKKEKGKKKAKKGKKDTKESSKKLQSSSTSRLIKKPEGKSFDPFGENFVLTKCVEDNVADSVQDEIIKVVKQQYQEEWMSKEWYESYRRGLYYTIYLNLCQAVDAVVDTLESYRIDSAESRFIRDIVASQPADDKCIFHPKPQVPQDEVETPTDETTINTQEEMDAFINEILEKHWKRNTQTKQYLIRGLLSTGKMETAKSVFTFIQKKEVEISESETLKGMQDKSTDVKDFDVEFYPKEYELLQPLKTKYASSSSSSTLTKSGDLFYYLDEDEISVSHEFSDIKVVVKEIGYTDD